MGTLILGWMQGASSFQGNLFWIRIW